MQLRQPIVAGRFYPDDPDGCRIQLRDCLDHAVAAPDLPTTLYAGIVPHAGWMCSGHVTAAVFRALAKNANATTLVLFGAVHRWPGRTAAVYDRGAWETPLGPVQVDSALADDLLTGTNLFSAAPDAHQDEHSLEVQMPFVKLFFPNARVLPIMVPPSDTAVRVGQSVGRRLQSVQTSAIVLGTSDLTHYGPSYGFTPHGVGESALQWAKNVNDRHMVELILNLAADKIVDEASAHRNACGAGAIAATIAAAQELGANRAALLQHTTSQEALSHSGANAVGYAGVVIGA